MITNEETNPKMGLWIKTIVKSDGWKSAEIRCSVCGDIPNIMKDLSKCQKCGIKMWDGKNDNKRERTEDMR